MKPPRVLPFTVVEGICTFHNISRAQMKEEELPPSMQLPCTVCNRPLELTKIGHALRYLEWQPIIQTDYAQKHLDNSNPTLAKKVRARKSYKSKS